MLNVSKPIARIRSSALREHVARVALVRLPVRRDDVADHPADDGLALAAPA